MALKQQRKKAADSSGFEDNFSKGRADEKCRGKQVFDESAVFFNPWLGGKSGRLRGLRGILSLGSHLALVLIVGGGA